MATSSSSGGAGGGGGGAGSSGTWYDQYGNAYGGIAGGGSFYLPQGASITYPSTAYTNVPINYTINTSGTAYWNQPLKADSATLTRMQVSDLIEEMTTRVQPGEKIVICLEYSVTDQQMDEIRRILADLQIEGILIRQARAAIPPLPMPFSAKEQRVDYLARILDLWEQRPGLLLTDLLSFYKGEQMGDNEFVTAAEVHFRMGLA